MNNLYLSGTLDHTRLIDLEEKIAKLQQWLKWNERYCRRELAQSHRAEPQYASCIQFFSTQRHVQQLYYQPGTEP